MTLLLVFIFGSLFLLFNKLFKNKINFISNNIFSQGQKRQEAANSNINYFIDLIFYGKKFLRSYFIQKNFNFLNISALNQFLSILPKYMLEIFTFSSVVLVVISTIVIDQDLNNVITYLTLFLISGYKILPSLNVIYSSNIFIKSNEKLFNDVIKDLNKIKSIKNEKIIISRKY